MRIILFFLQQLYFLTISMKKLLKEKLHFQKKSLFTKMYKNFQKLLISLIQNLHKNGRNFNQL